MSAKINVRRWIVILTAAMVSLSALATPSTLITIPSTDIQPVGIWHFGVDNTLYTGGDTAPAPFVDVGLTYGITRRVEAGIDLITGTDSPLWGQCESVVAGT
jgi:hypothetical protein